MTVLVTGASGFIGRHLLGRLRERGHGVRTLGRRNADFVWDALAGPAPAAAFEGAGAVVHLAGEPVAQRWNPEVKRRIRDSRVLGTDNLVAGMAAAGRRPEVLVASSAIGFYGATGENAVTEASPPGQGFLADTCVEWERSALRARELGVRVALLRTGIVLGLGGGALQEMLPPFRMALGGKIGSGRQWVSWIHLEDMLSLIVFAVENAVAGPLNATSPNPVRNQEFTRALAAALGRPAVLTIPPFALKLRFGAEAADHMMDSSRVLPAETQRSGFEFRHAEIGPALQELLREL